ncbi:polysaccharide deacetylase family protein [Patescibacteria group bacterium]|nr:polysaccharide deacetylase family protein [Patescibacteria group bacterium]MBU1449228.1 polysaccharide deacetylase family protein [Patescibacteria group bacterium]MBU2594199.1 polysaccharide deacetylase family protein [Candidatus Edwardsbacteria bacterium]
MKYIILHQVGNAPGRFTITPERANRVISSGRANVITFDDGYQSVFEFLVKQSHILPNVILFIVAGKVGGTNSWDKTGELAGQKLMDWDQIKELHRFGVKIGSHGLNHIDPTKVTDGELEKELKGSKRIIEENINAKVESFAYPFGYFNERVIAFVKEAGYKEAYTTCDSVLQGWGNPYRKGRIEITGAEPDWLVKAKINGSYDLKVIFELPKLVVEKTWLMLKPR